MGLEKRLNGRLLEGVVENALIKLGYKDSEVREDVQVLEKAPDNFIGKFATFKEGSADKYVKDWKDSSFFFFSRKDHKSVNGKNSKEIENTGVILKFYDGAASLSDNVPNHIGFVKSGFIDHSLEAIKARIDMNLNIGQENALEVKKRG